MDAQDPDRCLMERVVDGDQGAFQVLIDRYWPRLVVYAEEFVARRPDAEDAVQEAWIRVWQRRDTWKPVTTVSAWLYRITRNVALNRGLSARRRSDREEGAADTVSPTAPPTPFEHLAAERLRDEMRRAIAGLPERRREIFVLSRFHGLTHREIAETLDLSPQTVSNQVTSALDELRHRLGTRSTD